MPFCHPLGPHASYCYITPLPTELVVLLDMYVLDLLIYTKCFFVVEGETRATTVDFTLLFIYFVRV